MVAFIEPEHELPEVRDGRLSCQAAEIVEHAVGSRRLRRANPLNERPRRPPARMVPV